MILRKWYDSRFKKDSKGVLMLVAEIDSVPIFDAVVILISCALGGIFLGVTIARIFDS